MDKPEFEPILSKNGYQYLYSKLYPETNKQAKQHFDTIFDAILKVLEKLNDSNMKQLK